MPRRAVDISECDFPIFFVSLTFECEPCDGAALTGSYRAQKLQMDITILQLDANVGANSAVPFEDVCEVKVLGVIGDVDVIVIIEDCCVLCLEVVHRKDCVTWVFIIWHHC